MIRKFKINGMPKESEYNGMPFGRQLDYRHVLAAFKASARTVHLSQKRQTYQKAIKEAIELHGITEYFCQFNCSKECKDDSFELLFKSAE